LKFKTRHLKLGTAVLLCSAACNAPAVDFIQTNQFDVAADQVLTEETWLSARTLTVSGTVSEDLFATAQSAELSGTFEEDIWCIGNDIRTTGVFNNGARLMSRTLQIQGTGNGPVTVAGTTVKVDRSAVLNNGLLCLAENVIAEGNITGPVRIFAQRVTLGGKIDGNVSITAQEIVVLPGTRINGRLTYTAPDELILPSSVILNGTLHKRLDISASKSLLKDNLPGHFLFGLAALVTGLVFAGLFPRYTASTLHALKASPGLCSLTGFAALVMMPLAAFLMLFTVVGFPLSILILLFYLILLYLSKIAVALWIGSLILRRSRFNQRKTGGPLAIGLILLYSLTAFKAVSFPVHLLIIMLGLGALLSALFRKPALPDLADYTKLI
jgi:cytoskeletal protein CcmA (bactofilin family)